MSSRKVEGWLIFLVFLAPAFSCPVFFFVKHKHTSRTLPLDERESEKEREGPREEQDRSLASTWPCHRHLTQVGALLQALQSLWEVSKEVVLTLTPSSSVSTRSYRPSPAPREIDREHTGKMGLFPLPLPKKELAEAFKFKHYAVETLLLRSEDRSRK